ncbi:hypothetical protein ACGFX4_39450 [Kitasatospora sp. NPDC048365]|uniref:hypothetical protein n=1 Tax=Kitasatospora sp. NPDC048365 TaxID=3364050 RepID=UPI003715C161
MDELHDRVGEVAAAQGRLRAVWDLRRSLPGLSPAEAPACVCGLLDGEAPAQLVVRAAAELVEPGNPVLGVRTVRGGTGR